MWLIAWTAWKATSPKKEQELWQREWEHEQCQEYDKIFIRLYHFAERYLDKLVNEQCHRNVKQLGKHIEYSISKSVIQKCVLYK